MNKKPAITFNMRAYNAERYIEEAIKSVLNQSLENIEFILINNASTDNTGKICKYYAERDSRIVYLENEKNSINYPEYKSKWAVPKGEYVSYIDSDDYIHRDFSKELYTIAKRNSADMVVCGTEIFSDSNKNAKYRRIPPKINVENAYEIQGKFEDFYGTLRTIWGKLYRTDFFFKHLSYVTNKPDWLISGSDTLSVLRYLSKCARFISCDKALYFYRVYDESYYNKNLSIYRLYESEFLYNEAFQLLESWNGLNEDRISFLEDVYMNSVIDCIANILKNSQESLFDRLTLLHAIAENKLFYEILLNKNKLEEIYNSIDDCIGVLKRGMTNEDIDISDFYLLKVNMLLQNERIFTHEEFLMVLLSLICNQKNVNIWGKTLFEKKVQKCNDMDNKIVYELKKSINDNINIYQSLMNFKNSINGIDYDKNIDVQINQYINSFNQSITMSNYNAAFQIVNQIQHRWPLSAEGLYLKLILAIEMEQYIYAGYVAEIAVVFWPQEPILMSLCADIFNYNGQKVNSKKLYVKSIELIEDDNFKAEIKEKLSNI